MPSRATAFDESFGTSGAVGLNEIVR